MFIESLALNNFRTARNKRIRKPKDAIPKELLIKKSATLAPIGPHQLFTSRLS